MQRPESLIDQVLGHYHIIRQIGYGGMATVFLAEDINLGRDVAVKVFWPRPGETRDFLRRFELEARVLAKLDHPNILAVYDYGEHDSFAYLVTPYMAGGSLKELLQKRKALPPIEALQLTLPILNALQYASERGLIHRDIKPGNILFKADGSPVLADFGLVKVFAPEGENNALQTATANDTGPAVAGTPEYMSPEQIHGKATPVSDIYSVGIVLYEMLCGQRPFSSTNILSMLMQQVNELPRPLRQHNPYISPQLEAVVLRALEKDPDRRYQRPVDFSQALIHAGSPGMVTNLELISPTMAPNSPVPSPISAPGFAGNAQQTQSSPERGQSPTRSRTIANTGQPPGAAISTPAPAPLTQVSQNYRASVSSDNFAVPPAAQKKRSNRIPLLIIVISLLVLAGLGLSLALTPLGQRLFGQGQYPTPTPTGIANTPGVNNTPPVKGATPPSTGVPSGPTTITACPAPGKGRAPVMTAMSQGLNANIVYFVNEFHGTTSTFGTLKRFDTVTGAKTEILKIPGARIDNAQISSDGQWILFTEQFAGQVKLAVVRLDGQGLQTLACAPGGSQITSPQWSIDQKLIVFDISPASGGATIYLLTLANGSLQAELTPPASGLAYIPRTWLDFTRVLLIGYLPNSDAGPQNIYILDTSKGPNQHSSNLQQLATVGSATPCWDFDSSFDGKTVFINQCQPGQPEGNSTVEAQQTTGGATASPIFSSATLAISSVRVFDNNNASLLATASNSGPGVDGNHDNDGLYKIATDGSNTAVRLASTAAGQVCELNLYSQYYWSNVSLDRRQYALEEIGSSGANAAYTLLYGSLSGGAPKTIASIADGTELRIAGWTTL